MMRQIPSSGSLNAFGPGGLGAAQPPVTQLLSQQIIGAPHGDRAEGGEARKGLGISRAARTPESRSKAKKQSEGRTGELDVQVRSIPAGVVLDGCASYPPPRKGLSASWAAITLATTARSSSLGSSTPGIQTKSSSEASE
jgi:hypothetical protein